ncbi:hypothetical protein F4778DRAFT_589049 [Xylariomycetidae sp. FL2044]|nr:hypothetical protein F4778DRAFT_589049 [Xylariomycetidae sp. FL2044]
MSGHHTLSLKMMFSNTGSVAILALLVGGANARHMHRAPRQAPYPTLASPPYANASAPLSGAALGTGSSVAAETSAAASVSSEAALSTTSSAAAISATALGNSTSVTAGVATQPPVVNGTDGASLTTLTISSTLIETVISCAPTVTNCPAASDTDAISSLPAGAASTVLVTNVVDVTTTVCPVSEAASVSASIVQSFTVPPVTLTSTIPGGESSSSTAAAEVPAGSAGSGNVPTVTGVPGSGSTGTAQVPGPSGGIGNGEHPSGVPSGTAGTGASSTLPVGAPGATDSNGNGEETQAIPSGAGSAGVSATLPAAGPSGGIGSSPVTPGVPVGTGVPTAPNAAASGTGVIVPPVGGGWNGTGSVSFGTGSLSFAASSTAAEAGDSEVPATQVITYTAGGSTITSTVSIPRLMSASMDIS